MTTLQEHDVYVNTKRVSAVGSPNHPVLTRFSPDGHTLYVLDHGVRTIPKSGALWTITRQ